MPDRPTLADIRDKDDAHPHGVVGWRREYHAMREAIDAVLALHEPLDGQYHDCEEIATIERFLDLGGDHA